MTVTAFELISGFLTDMEDYWEGNSRQLKKSAGRVARLQKHHNLTNVELAQQLSVLADQRIAKKSRTLYLSSFGSSGSHLIQHAINLTTPAQPLGEVYIAPGLEKALQNLTIAERYKLIEMYHLAHSVSPSHFASGCVIINTAHKSKLQTYADCTNEFSSAFILRNPIELVLSRTFRKGEYRNYLGKDEMSDTEYLSENIERTTRFYNLALNYNYDEFLLFEDVKTNRDRMACSVAKLLGNPAAEHEFSGCLQVSMADGEATNKFSGTKVEYSEHHLEFANEKLMPLVIKINELLERRGISQPYLLN